MLMLIDKLCKQLGLILISIKIDISRKIVCIGLVHFSRRKLYGRTILLFTSFAMGAVFLMDVVGNCNFIKFS